MIGATFLAVLMIGAFGLFKAVMPPHAPQPVRAKINSRKS